MSGLHLRGLLPVFALLSCSVAAQQNLLQQLSPQYRKWLDEDVRWIITDTERNEFFKLSSDDQRRRFVEDFWAKRNPLQNSTENPFKEEHYRRMAYANEHFAATVAGWRTDRGRIYIVYGPPDLVESFRSDWRFPVETWHYRNTGVSLRFIDKCRCGDYHLINTSPKND